MKKQNLNQFEQRNNLTSIKKNPESELKINEKLDYLDNYPSKLSQDPEQSQSRNPLINEGIIKQTTYQLGKEKEVIENNSLFQQAPENEENQQPTSHKNQIFVNKLAHFIDDDYKSHNILKFKDFFTEDYDQKENALDNVESVFMTTFGFESQLLEPIAKSGANFVVMNDRSAGDTSTPLVWPNYNSYQNWTVIHPNKVKSGYYPGAFHPKLWLIKFTKFLRVVISSANLHVADWAVWSNVAWTQDFYLKSEKCEESQKPEEKLLTSQLKKTESCEYEKQSTKKGLESASQTISSSQKISESKSKEFFPYKKLNQTASKLAKNVEFNFDSDFYETLEDFLTNLFPDAKQNYQSMLKISLKDYQFSNVNVVLISSIPGNHDLAKSKKYGLGKVKEVMKKFEPKQQKGQYCVTYQATSLGNPNNMAAKFYQAFTSKNDATLEIVFPTKNYIENEILVSETFANCLIMKSQEYYKDSFPKQSLCKYQGSSEYAFHQGSIPHSKICIFTNPKHQINDDTMIYLGSHNFTQAAWGMIKKTEEINITNTEIGIFFPPFQKSAELKASIINTLPFQYPPPKYGQKDIPYLITFN